LFATKNVPKKWLTNFFVAPIGACSAGGVTPKNVGLLPRSVQDFRRREHEAPINRFFYPQGGINKVGSLKSVSFEMSSASMFGVIESGVAYAKAIMFPCPLGSR
jgi:hypothetical protein